MIIPVLCLQRYFIQTKAKLTPQNGNENGYIKILETHLLGFQSNRL